jgi:electron transfer flavoprotein alpha subunit
MTVLTLVEHVAGAVTELSLQALTAGRRLAEQLATDQEAIVFGTSGAELEQALKPYGVSTLQVVDGSGLNLYAPAAWGRALAGVARETGARAVIAAASERGAEVMAHAAASLDAPLAANCVDVAPGDPFLVTRQRWGGSLLEEARVSGDVKLFTIAPHAVQPEPASQPRQIRVHHFQPEVQEKDLRVHITPEREAETGKVSLAQARVVVGGGRGVGSAEGFALLKELAELLGGTVGCSRAVTSLGWRPHSDQVGQTGTRIAPELYIACGISGAIQHMVGCRAAKKIMAINTDANAPIVAQADYAVIGDALQIVSAVVEEIKKSSAVGLKA